MQVISEAPRVVRTKRMSASKRAAARRSYRRRKFRIKRALKRRKRTAVFKRRKKLLKRLKKRIKTGGRRRLRLSIEQILGQPLFEMIKNVKFVTEGTVANYLEQFELTDKLKEALKEQGLLDQVKIVKEADGDEPAMAVLDAKIASDLERTFKVFTDGKAQDEYEKEAIEAVESFAKEVIAEYDGNRAKDFEVEATVSGEDRYTGSDAAAVYLTISYKGEEKEIEHGSLYYLSGDIIYNAMPSGGGWDWAFWLGHEDSPFYDDAWVSDYEKVERRQALAELASDLKHSDLDKDIERAIESLIDMASEEVEESVLKEASDKKVAEYGIVDHGMEHAQYWQGHGVSRTKWDATATGVGVGIADALEDAADQLAEMGWDISDELDKEIEQIKSKHKDVVVGTNLTVTAHIEKNKVEDFHVDAEARLLDVDDKGELLHEVDLDKFGTGQVQFTIGTVDLSDVMDGVSEKLKEMQIEVPEKEMSKAEEEVRAINDMSEHYYYISIDVKGEDDSLTEADPSLQPPKKWFGKMLKKVGGKDKAAVVGAIWRDLDVEKKKEIRGREGKTYGPAESIELQNDIALFESALKETAPAAVESLKKIQALADKVSKAYSQVIESQGVVMESKKSGIVVWDGDVALELPDFVEESQSEIDSEFSSILLGEKAPVESQDESIAKKVLSDVQAIQEHAKKVQVTAEKGMLAEDDAREIISGMTKYLSEAVEMIQAEDSEVGSVKLEDAGPESVKKVVAEGSVAAKSKSLTEEVAVLQSYIGSLRDMISDISESLRPISEATVLIDYDHSLDDHQMESLAAKMESIGGRARYLNPKQWEGPRRVRVQFESAPDLEVVKQLATEAADALVPRHVELVESKALSEKEMSDDKFSVSWLKQPITQAKWDEITNKYKGWKKGKVRWFDKSSGEGYVRLSDGPLSGMSVFVHGSAFGGDPNFGQGTDFEAVEGMEVLVKLFIDTTYIQVSKMKPASGGPDGKKQMGEGVNEDNSLNSAMEDLADKTGLTFDGGGDDRLFAPEMINVNAAEMTKQEYKKMEKEMRDFSIKGEGFEVYVWNDVSGYEYWKEAGENNDFNYIQITASIKDPKKVNPKELVDAFKKAVNVFEKYENVVQDVDVLYGVRVKKESVQESSEELDEAAKKKVTAKKVAKNREAFADMVANIQAASGPEKNLSESDRSMGSKKVVIQYDRALSDGESDMLINDLEAIGGDVDYMGYDEAEGMDSLNVYFADKPDMAKIARIATRVEKGMVPVDMWLSEGKGKAPYDEAAKKKVTAKKAAKNREAFADMAANIQAASEISRGFPDEIIAAAKKGGMLFAHAYPDMDAALKGMNVIGRFTVAHIDDDELVFVVNAKQIKAKEGDYIFIGAPRLKGLAKGLIEKVSGGALYIAGMGSHLEESSPNGVRVKKESVRESSVNKGVVSEAKTDVDKEADKILGKFLKKYDAKVTHKEVEGELPEVTIDDVTYMYGNGELLAVSPTHSFVWMVDRYGDRYSFELFEVRDENDELVESAVNNPSKSVDESSSKADIISKYKEYAAALKSQDMKSAMKHAQDYNKMLKDAGGPAKNPGEMYLTMGKPGYKLDPQYEAKEPNYKFLEKEYGPMEKWADALFEDFDFAAAWDADHVYADSRQAKAKLEELKKLIKDGKHFEQIEQKTMAFGVPIVGFDEDEVHPYIKKNEAYFVDYWPVSPDEGGAYGAYPFDLDKMLVHLGNKEVSESSNEDFVTIYLKKEFVKDETALMQMADKIEKAVKRDVAVVGNAGLNVYTKDRKIIEKAIEVIGAEKVAEWSDETLEHDIVQAQKEKRNVAPVSEGIKINVNKSEVKL